MEFAILGPLEVRRDGDVVALGGPKPRALLALLLAHANESVSAERLAVGLWGEDAPAGAVRTVQVHVSRLRKALGDEDLLATSRAGYRLRVRPGELDVERFERLVDDARRAMAESRAEQAGKLLREALGLWRGPPLADLALEPFAQAEIARLEEQRLAAVEARIEADLAVGRQAELVAELQRLVGEHPLRERLHAQRMLALYRCGRQTEALDAFREARRVLVEDVGVEPGPELRGLQEAILRHDASLGLEPADLPHELRAGAAPAIVGRDRELEWLRARWERALAGAGELVVVMGAVGMGKTRLAVELAAEVHRAGAEVLYASGWGHPEALVAAARRAREATRPTLLVVDDADASGAALAAVDELARQLSGTPVLGLAIAHRHEGLVLPGAESLLALSPLDAEAVRSIAVGYAPGHAAVDVPVEELVETSGGVPRRVHEVASAWARRAAAHRVVASAPRASAGRAELRWAEAELAEGVFDFQAARERADLVAAREATVVCPFKGLASFEVADARYFFGRERLVAELVARAVGAPALGVIGPSGSGKSSVVRAGLLPALASGVLPGIDEWPQVLLRPGEHPMRELHSSRLEALDDAPVVLAVDQFEEVFTSCHDEDERTAFFDALLSRLRAGGGLVVLAVRADFYARCATYPTLAKLLGPNHVLVGPMEREELRRAIELPAQRAGLIVEPELVDALLADIADEPGALPLLSTALLELWQRSDGHQLRLATYEHTGGVRGAVARFAEEAFDQLDPPQQAVARTVLLRLAGEGAAGSVVRQRVALAELRDGSDDDRARVLAVLTDRRLLTISAATVEVAHEALLREWPRLRGWLEEDAEGRRVHRHLAEAARDWDERARDPRDVYGGARLALALEWRAGHEHQLNSTERAFLAASRTAAGRAQRRLRLALAGVAAMLLIAAVGGVIALHQRSTARMQARAAQAQRLGIQALTETDLDRSLLLAREGVALDDSPATRSNLLTALLRAPAAVGVIPGAGNPPLVLDISPSGRTLAVGDSRGTVLFFDVATRRRVGPPYKPSGEVTALRFSPDGRRLAVGSDTVDLVDTRTHKSIRQLFADPDLDVPQLGSVVFSSDSRVVAADLSSLERRSRIPPHYMQRWSAVTGRRLGDARSISAGALVGSIAGDKHLVTSSPAGRETDVRDAATLRLIRRWRGGGAPATVSSDGRTLAYGARDGSVHLLDLRTGKLRVAVGRHDAPVTALRFVPNSRALVSAAADGGLIVWDVKRGTRSETLENPTGGVSQLAIATDGRTAYLAGQNGSVSAWDLSGTRRLARPFRVPPPPTFPGLDVSPGVPAPDVVASPDGKSFAITDRTGYAALFDSQTLARTGRVRLSPGAHLITVAIAPDGRTMAATTLEGDLVFADLRTHRPLGPPIPADNPPAVALAFSGDGRWLATSSGDTLALMDAQRRTFVRQLALGSNATDVSISPDGRTLAATVDNRDGSGGLDIVPVPLFNSIRHVRAPAGRWGRFSRDGRLLVYGDEAGRARLFDTTTWKPRGKPFVGHTGAVLTANLSSNGQTLATTSLDGTTRLWDVPTGRAIGPALPGEPDHAVGATFVDGDRGLVTVDDDGRGYLWDVRPESWARRACEVAGRTLTHDEWQNVLPERHYAPACASP